MEKEIAKLKKENHALKRKIERIQLYIPEAKKLLISRALPAELVHELFASLPLENAFDLLATMPNGLLARNVRKILKSIEMAMKANKWNEADCGCGPKLAISEGGLVVKHSGPFGWNSVRAQMAIPKFNLNANKSAIAYFEVEIVAISNWWGISIGFCTQQFPLEGNWLGDEQNSIGIGWKGGINIVGSRNNFNNGGGHFKTAGEVVGIGIAHSPANFPTMKCFATLNGQFLGKVDLPIKFANLSLFPAVTMFHVNDSICANFGSGTWQYKPVLKHLAN